MPVLGPDVAEFFEEPTATQYAEFGRYVAAQMAIHPSAAAIMELADAWIKQHWGYAQYPRNSHLRAQWEAVADDILHGQERAREAAAAAVKEQTDGNS